MSLYVVCYLHLTLLFLFNCALNDHGCRCAMKHIHVPIYLPLFQLHWPKASELLSWCSVCRVSVLSSVCASIIFSFKKLLKNYWLDFYQISLECSLSGPLVIATKIKKKTCLNLPLNLLRDLQNSFRKKNVPSKNKAFMGDSFSFYYGIIKNEVTTTPREITLGKLLKSVWVTSLWCFV